MMRRTPLISGFFANAASAGRVGVAIFQRVPHNALDAGVRQSCNPFGFLHKLRGDTFALQKDHFLDLNGACGLFVVVQQIGLVEQRVAIQPLRIAQKTGIPEMQMGIDNRKSPGMGDLLLMYLDYHSAISYLFIHIRNHVIPFTKWAVGHGLRSRNLLSDLAHTSNGEGDSSLWSE